MTDDPLRWGLGLGWLLVGLACFVRRGQAPALRTGLGLLALGLSSIALFRWNMTLLRAGQSWLHESGLYEQRILFKLAIAALLIVALFVLAVLWRRVARGISGHGTLLCGLGLGSLFVLSLTLSLDNFMPGFIADPPGRFVVEYFAIALALAGALKRREPS